MKSYSITYLLFLVRVYINVFCCVVAKLPVYVGTVCVCLILSGSFQAVELHNCVLNKYELLITNGG